MNVPIPNLHKCIYVRPNHLWSSFICRSEYKGFYETLQIAFPNNVLVSQFCGWSLVCSIDIYIPRCLIIDCLYRPQYISHPPFLEWSDNLWAHWLCATTTASYTLVYLWIFIDYYGKCEMADASTYLEWSNLESTHIYGLLVNPRKRGAESAELTSI